MIKAGVIGHPVAHSKSPVIHGHWFNAYRIEGEYQAIDIAPDQLKSGIQKLIDEGYAGFNVTVPHKINVMKLCDTLDDDAQAIGAVNTVVVRDGKLHGYNTDAFGFIENLKNALADFDINQTAVLLGAGGAARAIVHALLKEGAPRILICNRSYDKAEELARMDTARIDILEWENRSSMEECGLLINSTSLGMKGQPPLNINLVTLPSEAVVYDIVYAPLMTDFLRQGQLHGHPIVTGIGMLLHQARPAFKAWTGVMPKVDRTLMDKVLT